MAHWGLNFTICREHTGAHADTGLIFQASSWMCQESQTWKGCERILCRRAATARQAFVQRETWGAARRCCLMQGYSFERWHSLLYEDVVTHKYGNDGMSLCCLLSVKDSFTGKSFQQYESCKSKPIFAISQSTLCIKADINMSTYLELSHLYYV